MKAKQALLGKMAGAAKTKKQLKAEIKKIDDEIDDIKLNDL